jgi:SAM-dependent methyltransferase
VSPLDLACGTGRLLIPYLRAGLDVDGCDVSADMVALCREKAAREGLSPTLFVQAMHELDPLRRYKAIFVCGAFGLGLQPQEVLPQRGHGHYPPPGVGALGGLRTGSWPLRGPHKSAWFAGERRWGSGIRALRGPK